MRLKSVLGAALLATASTLVTISPALAATIGNTTANCSSSLTTSSGTFDTLVVESGGDCIVIFRVSSNDSSASGTWTLPAGTYSVQYLVVGGGGSSSRGTCSLFWGSGGGGGEVLTGTTPLSGTVNITVGKGGVGTGNCASTVATSPTGADGANSVLASITARAGRGGSSGAVGGSSGNLNSGGTGNGGVNGCTSPTNCNAGGGGGAASGGSGLNAGNGVSSILSGSSVVYGAGGAGRGNTDFGTSESTCAGTSSRTNAVMHTGCGGSDAGSAMGSGGSGIVVAVYAYDTTAPSFTNGTSFSFAENTATSTNAATITVSESSTITLISTGDYLLFTVVTSDSTTARIRFASSPNFESPGDSGANNIYDLSVRATDTAGNAANQSITITVTNVNEAPTITTASSNPAHAISQAENISSVLTYTGSDVDAGTTLTWSISGTDASFFAINSSSGVLTFTSAPDFESAQDDGANNSYVVTITLSDGSLTDIQTLTVTITNANESASINAPTTSSAINKGIATTISVTVNTAGKVRFFVGGKRITNCLARTTSGSYPTFTATCSWRPAVTGRQSLTARVTPTDNTFSASTSAGSEVFVLRRGTVR